MHNIASYIDHTALKPFVTGTQIEKLCEEALHCNFKTVCIPPSFVSLANASLKGRYTRICTVIGFPLGYHTLSSKLQEAEEAIQNGASELDVVMNIGKFKSRQFDEVEQELTELANLVHTHQHVLKVIIETAYLDESEIHLACRICTAARVDFVKTSTGFAPTGALLSHIILMRSILPVSIRIKASGGIKTYSEALQFIEAGADRIGTSSGGSDNGGSSLDKNKSFIKMNRYLIFTFLLFIACTKPATTRSVTSNINRYEEDLSANRPKYVREQAASSVSPSGQSNQGKITTDGKRLDITEKLENKLDSIAVYNKTIRYAQGYRIQIYAGSDRREAEQAKSTSYELFPEITPYLLYIQPTYRVKAGDFLDRVEAERYYIVYKASYPDAIVVPDKIDIKNTFSVYKK